MLLPLGLPQLHLNIFVTDMKIVFALHTICTCTCMYESMYVCTYGTQHDTTSTSNFLLQQFVASAHSGSSAGTVVRAKTVERSYTNTRTHTHTYILPLWLICATYVRTYVHMYVGLFAFIHVPNLQLAVHLGYVAWWSGDYAKFILG